MKLKCSDALKITADFSKHSDGNCELWIRGVWLLIKEHRLNECQSDLELLRFYALLYGACRVYATFSDLITDTNFNDDIYLDIDYQPFTMFEKDSENAGYIKEYISNVISEESNIGHFFDLLRTTMNSSKVFAVLYYAYHYQQFSLEDFESDEYYYGGITDPEELENAIFDNTDYEQRKYYATCDEDTIVDEILNDIDVHKLSAFEWIDSCMGN